MPSQAITLAALEAEYAANPAEFKQSSIDILFPSAVYGTAKAARGEHPFRMPQRWACLAGLRAAGMLAMKAELSVAFLIAERVGVKDPAEAERLLDAANRARGASPDDTLRLAMRIVRERIMADPEFRRRSMQELYGLIDAPASVIAAPKANGNGSHA